MVCKLSAVNLVKQADARFIIVLGLREPMGHWRDTEGQKTGKPRNKPEQTSH